jgi:hypothetical protein
MPQHNSSTSRAVATNATTVTVVKIARNDNASATVSSATRLREARSSRSMTGRHAGEIYVATQTPSDEKNGHAGG